MLRLQQYIELVRADSPAKLVEALAHAKKHLIPYWNAYPKDVRQACGLLAFPPSSPSAPYAHLYDEARWSDLADLFTSAHNTLLALPSVPLLHVALSSGLSALKTPACHHRTDADAAPPSTLGHGVCPICSIELNDLARNVPYAHHTKSHVENDLVLLPNGRVCGEQRLEDQSRKSGLPADKMKDPQTGDVFNKDELKKVYIT